MSTLVFYVNDDTMREIEKIQDAIDPEQGGYGVLAVTQWIRNIYYAL